MHVYTHTHICTFILDVVGVGFEEVVHEKIVAQHRHRQAVLEEGSQGRKEGKGGRKVREGNVRDGTIRCGKGYEWEERKGK
jgi:hypothetical protein